MTLLAIPVDQIANLSTFQLPNNNTSQPFYFDRESAAPFALPDGCSFVVKDIIITPETTNFTPAQFYLVVITADGGRTFEIRCDGRGAHVSLASGLVVPDKKTASPGEKGLTARNTTFSTGPVNVQVMGYFVKASTGLAVGTAFKP